MSKSLAYEKRWRLDRANGVSRSYVPMGPVAQHVAGLVEQGATPRGVALVAQVAPTSVSRILAFSRGTQLRGARLQRATAARLLAVTMEHVRHRDDLDGLVPSLSTVRRLEALQALGWPHAEIDGRLGRLVSANLMTHRYGMVARRTALAVESVYDELSTRRGPSEITRRRASRRGFAPPLAWDDIDDPAEQPTGIAHETSKPGDERIDEIAVARVVAGESINLTPAERAVAIRRLAAVGMGDPAIAARCLVSSKTIARDRAAHGIPAGVAPTSRPRATTTSSDLRRTA